MQNTLMVTEKKDFKKNLLSIVQLPDALIDCILDFSVARENAMMASSCLAMWHLLNKNRHWFVLTGMHKINMDQKKVLLASQNIITDNVEAGIPEYAVKEYFLRINQPDHILKGSTKCDGDKQSFENTKLRNLLINSYKHIIIFPHVAYRFFVALRSPSMAKFLIAISSCYPYASPLLYSFLNKLMSINDWNSYQTLPNIALLKSDPTEVDILQVQKKSLLIFRQHNENLFLHYMHPTQGYATIKINPSIAAGDNPAYRTLFSLFSSVQSARYTLQSLPNNHHVFRDRDVLYKELIEMVREMKVPIRSIHSTRNSAGAMCVSYASASMWMVSFNLSDLLEAAFSTKRSPLIAMASLVLTITLFLSIYFLTKKVIESCYGPIKADKKTIACLPQTDIKLHHEFSTGNCNTHFQPLSSTNAITNTSLNVKKNL